MALLGVFQCLASPQSCVVVVCRPARRSVVDFGCACALLCFYESASCSGFTGLWWIGVVPWCCVALCLGVVLLFFLISFADLKWHLNMWCRAALWIRAVLLCLDISFVDLWWILDADLWTSPPSACDGLDADLFCCCYFGCCRATLSSSPSICGGSGRSAVLIFGSCGIVGGIG
ncbi:hypothetical protein GOP47_0001486 [Adiantum capillus-veneris]|uniref:Transmembrane protein n=1 Tax=Adiantum capillus-veneris TaxID=13818 RepID=A0A9D4ZN40_ADICA|nr:hypothetical protein GOP47_0001486 [Adiantum capillus-veneris]